MDKQLEAVAKVKKYEKYIIDRENELKKLEIEKKSILDKYLK